MVAPVFLFTFPYLISFSWSS